MKTEYKDYLSSFFLFFLPLIRFYAECNKQLIKQFHNSIKIKRAEECKTCLDGMYCICGQNTNNTLN